MFRLTDTLSAITRTGLKAGVKTGESFITVLGPGEPLDFLQRTVEKLPGADQAKRLAEAALKGSEPAREPLYKEEPGPYEVSTYRHTFTDESRDREVPLTVYSPENSKEKSPVVVFSHGLAGNEATYRYLGRHLASHGYTVMQPTHVGSDTKAVVTKTPLFAFSQKEMVARSEDLKFSLDLLEGGKLPEEITGNADTENVALAGHSFGALTTTAVAGAVATGPNGKPLGLKDERFDAFIAMSPYGDSAPTHILGIDPSSYDQIEQPVMYLSGENDTLFTLGKGAGVHRVPYENTASEEKYHITVGGASHMDFGQVFGLSEPNTAELTKSSSVAFLDAQLRGDESAQAYLSDDLPRVAQARGSVVEGPAG